MEELAKLRQEHKRLEKLYNKTGLDKYRQDMSKVEKKYFDIIKIRLDNI